jgi:molecular chaperone DnaK
MSYGLGVDLGTTFTAAAVARDGRVEMATLGDHTDAVPSVVLIRDDGTVLTGNAAERRAIAEPDRFARAVKRRFGDPMPVILGGAPYPATQLIAYQLRDVVDRVSEREGGRPGTVTLTHPANWGPYKLELFAQVPVLAGLGEVNLLTEPEAAAAHYARNDRLEPGALIAVYDLGGGTFDATVLRTTEHGFEILGRPEGIEGLGGVDFDEAVFTHVDQTLDGAVSRLDPADPRATSAVIRLRNECVNAKEALSADTETSIPVLLPELQTEVRLTRGEFERMTRPAIGATIASLRRALQSAQVDPAQLHTVLLVGGSSRIPMVAHLVSAELGCPTSVDAHPKHAIALGAAAVGAARTGPEPVIVPPAPVETEPDHPAAPPTETAVAGGAIAAVPLLGAGGAGLAPPPLKDQKDQKGRFSRRGRAENNLVPDAGPDPVPAPEPDPEPEPEPFVPFDDQPHDTGGRRRTPVMIGALVLIAALAGGGTVAARALSHSTPPTNSTSVSHTSSSTPSPSGSTHSAHTAPAKLHGQGSHPITTTPVAPTTPAVHPNSEPASQPYTRTSPTHKASPTWTPTTTTTTPTWTPTTPTSPPPTSPSTSTSTGTGSGTGGSGTGGTGTGGTGTGGTGTGGSGTGTGGTSGSGTGTGGSGTGGNP